MANNPTESIPASWAGLEKYKQALQEIDGKTKESTSQVEHLLQLMGKAGPAAAELAEFVKSGPLMVFTAAQLAMDKYFEWVDKAQEKHKEMLATLVQFNHFQHELRATAGAEPENLTRIAQATAAATAPQNGVAETLKHFEASDRVYDLGKNDQLAGDIALRKAASSVQMQQIAMLEAAGKITPSRAEQARIETQHQENRATIKDRQDQAGSDLRSAQSTDIQGLPEKFAARAAAFGLLQKKMADLESLEPKLLAAEDQRAAMEKIAALEKAGETPDQIFQQGIKAMSILNGMSSQSIEGLQHGDAPQMAYIQNLLASKAAIGNLETAVGNNGKTVPEQIDRVLKMNSDLTNGLAATHSHALDIESRLKKLESQLGAVRFNGR